MPLKLSKIIIIGREMGIIVEHVKCYDILNFHTKIAPARLITRSLGSSVHQLTTYLALTILKFYAKKVAFYVRSSDHLKEVIDNPIKQKYFHSKVTFIHQVKI